jgi:hypothetical protein
MHIGKMHKDEVEVEGTVRTNIDNTEETEGYKDKRY